MGLHRVASLQRLWVGEMMSVVVDGMPVLLVNVDGQVRAYEDRCCHEATPLSEGFLDGKTIVCGAHFWSYDACTGCAVNPGGAQLRRFRVEVIGSHVLVDVTASPLEAGGGGGGEA